MAQAYDYLADWFEYLNDDCDYASWSQYFIDTLKTLDAGRKGLELGCGSGFFSRALTRAGYVMSGTDISAAMLTKASSLARAEGLRIPFFLADAAHLKTPEKYDFIIAPNDCYNYIPTAKLFTAFKSAAGALKSGGIFHFDLSSEYKLRDKVANNIFADDRDDVTYLVFNHLLKDRVEMDVTLFVKQKSGDFRRFDEKHTQYIHGEKDVLAALEAAGFTVLRVEGSLGEDKAGSDRLNFVCRK